jgi:type VI secretion system protein ImpL
MKKFFTFLLYLFIILLIAGVVFGIGLLLQRPLQESAIATGVILGAWLLIVLIKKLIIRQRAKAQVERILQKEDAIVDARLGKSQKELMKDLRKTWNGAVKALRKSHLKLRGDPLYVLPWYMVFGKPSSGKSTSLKNAKLLTPAMELSEHADGSTLNLEWWLYDQAIIIDTAGRYAVPDVDKRDRKEWATLLSMLSRHKQKEPLNGLVIVVAADRLLECSEEELVEEGQQVRAGINELMEKLEIQMPVYLMVTKCDLVDQFTNWCNYLPEESFLQVMGYLSEEQVTDIDQELDKAFDTVLNRIKELRLLMMERSDNLDDSLIELPDNMEKLRKGLHAFAQTALKDNLYQETPKFRGLYFSSSQQYVAEGGGVKTVNHGRFLHHLFTRVMPPDRGLLSTLPSAERLRRAFRNYGFGTSGVVLALIIVLMTSAYLRDYSQLSGLTETHTEFELQHDSINKQLYALNRLQSLINDLEAVENSWIVPWYGWYGSSPQRKQLKQQFVETFRSQVLESSDQAVSAAKDLKSAQTAQIVSGLVRRINMISAKNAGDDEANIDVPAIPEGYLSVLFAEVTAETSQIFSALYDSYIAMVQPGTELAEQQLNLAAALEHVLKSNRTNYAWLIDWVNDQGLPAVKLDDFWGGSRLVKNAAEVPAAYTLEGRMFLLRFLDELNLASEISPGITAIETDFLNFYNRRYLQAWKEFAQDFDKGKQKLRGRKEWLNALESMSGVENPYFTLMARIRAELAPVIMEGIFQARERIDYFTEIQAFAGDAAAGGDSKLAKKAAKQGLKVIGKFGKVGKLAAKAGKTGMKTQKKVARASGQGKQVDLDTVLEEAAKTYTAYKQALQDISFNADSAKVSFNATASIFARPDDPASGDGAGAEAWAAVLDLQRILGKPRQSTQIFWDLYTGPVRLAYDYMKEEAACYLQDSWQDKVLAELVGVDQDKLGEVLIGDGGLVWSFVEADAEPFLRKKYKKGYIPKIVNGRSMPWESDFMRFVNNADSGRIIVANEFTVRISALPTGINQSATISPYATYLDLHCADGIQTLANYNYTASNDFVWSLSQCGNTSLRIEVGEYSLQKSYKGRKGFAKFLADFRDGRRVFNVDEFPENASKLRNASVTTIDVQYKITGQAPVIQMLKSVPLAPPKQAIACWSS